MQDVIMRLVDVPIARMFVLAGIIFLMVAVLGKVEGKIDPGQVGRIGASVLGVVLMIIGVLMQYAEMHEVRQERISMLQQSVTSAITGGTTTSASEVAASADKASTKPDSAIKVVSGTFARACNGKPGNATALLSKACDGKASCDYAVEPVALEEAPASCAKDFAAEWKCGTGSTVYSATLPADALAKSEKLHLACAG